VSAGDFLAAASGLAIGAFASWVVARIRLAASPARLLRTNVSGAAVPAVLGDAVASGGVAGLAGTLLADRLAAAGRMALAAGIVLVLMWAAGKSDDLRGDEPERGFGGHLRAAATGRLTGGLVKILAGGIAGLGAGVLTAEGAEVLLVAALVALAANLFNLLDRAPGRAGKLWLVATALVLMMGTGTWAVVAAGTVGALCAVLPLDLAERGMLGDAGANPLGALWGLGLAHALPLPGALAAAVVLGALNLASERWSFSALIDRTPPLRALDRLGRK
jgi:UDP-GlcNAc:undecaprenyl-phosphate GlcNAc-1-phosphate transferase